MDNVIEAINLTKYYGELLAVDHVNFEVKKGEIFGFLGPNGAGKTTTIRMLTSLTKPSEGTARIFGHDIQSETLAAKRYMGIVPEISNIYDDLSAWDNLMFTGELYQVSKADREKKARELLELFGLYDAFLPRQVSAGLYQRCLRINRADALLGENNCFVFTVNILHGLDKIPRFERWLLPIGIRLLNGCNFHIEFLGCRSKVARENVNKEIKLKNRRPNREKNNP